MVLGLPVEYFKLEDFSCKVSLAAKDDAEIDLIPGRRFLPLVLRRRLTPEFFQTDRGIDIFRKVLVKMMFRLLPRP